VIETLVEKDRKTSTSYNKQNNTDYVYETIIYIEDTTGQRVVKRHVVGKIDPVTGNVVDTGPRGRPPHQKRPSTGSSHGEGDSEYKTLYEELLKHVEKEKRKAQKEQSRRLEALRSSIFQMEEIEKTLHSMRKALMNAMPQESD